MSDNAIAHPTYGSVLRVVSPELNKELIREVALYSYRVVYEIKTDAHIEVLAVIHKRQDFTEEDLP